MTYYALLRGLGETSFCGWVPLSMRVKSLKPIEYNILWNVPETFICRERLNLYITGQKSNWPSYKRSVKSNQPWEMLLSRTNHESLVLEVILQGAKGDKNLNIICADGKLVGINIQPLILILHLLLIRFLLLILLRSLISLLLLLSSCSCVYCCSYLFFVS